MASVFKACEFYPGKSKVSLHSEPLPIYLACPHTFVELPLLTELHHSNPWAAAIVPMFKAIGKAPEFLLAILSPPPLLMYLPRNDRRLS